MEENKIRIASKDNACLHCYGRGYVWHVLNYKTESKRYKETCLYCGGSGHQEEEKENAKK